MLKNVIPLLDLRRLGSASAGFESKAAALGSVALPVALTPEVSALLANDCVVAIGVSGGKDSDACALAVMAHLDAAGHRGPRLLIHADLGAVEWQDSAPSCQRLAAHLGVELVTVRRQAGDMMERWEGRWRNNLARYNDLSCMRLVLPWSTPSMRFCTSELKSAVIASALRKRFPDHPILSVTGIRRQESSSRAKMPVYALDKRLGRKNALGAVWNAIIEWPVEQVFSSIAKAGLRLHEAYRTYQASRVSCCFCIMSAAKDLLAAAGCTDNQDLYRRMVHLEAESTFAFQSGKWLGDVAPHLLGEALAAKLARAKHIAAARQTAEMELPAHLLYTDGWPTAMPTAQEAELIANVRRRVSQSMGLQAGCLSAQQVMTRFAELIATKQEKEAQKAQKLQKSQSSLLKKGRACAAESPAHIERELCAA